MITSSLMGSSWRKKLFFLSNELQNSNEKHNNIMQTYILLHHATKNNSSTVLSAME